MSYPGERVQIDVKFVPAACLVGAAAGRKFYQYTALDEFSRYRYLEAFEENSTYSSTPVSYTHLDVYKRQPLFISIGSRITIKYPAVHKRSDSAGNSLVLCVNT